MRGRALFSLLTAVAFATYSVFGVSASYAAPKAGVVEVKPGTSLDCTRVYGVCVNWHRVEQTLVEYVHFL